MTVLITGGCKNGKSTIGEDIVCSLGRREGLPLYYIATMIPGDGEDEARIRRHRESRKGKGFRTLERGTEIHKILEEVGGEGAFLLDSVTALVANEMFRADGSIHEEAGEKVSRELGELIRGVKHICLVSDYICADGRKEDKYTEGYRKALSQAERMIAGMAEIVGEVCVTRVIIHKGRERYEEIY